MEGAMGDWSDYFEDFPDEDPANYVDGRFDPQKARELRAKQNKLAVEQAALNAEIAAVIVAAQKKT
jgi:hypothetical protein